LLVEKIGFHQHFTLRKDRGRERKTREEGFEEKDLEKARGRSSFKDWS
jgi:hypothetical protein